MTTLRDVEPAEFALLALVAAAGQVPLATLRAFAGPGATHIETLIDTGYLALRHGEARLGSARPKHVLGLAQFVDPAIPTRLNAWAFWLADHGFPAACVHAIPSMGADPGCVDLLLRHGPRVVNDNATAVLIALGFIETNLLHPSCPALDDLRSTALARIGRPRPAETTHPATCHHRSHSRTALPRQRKQTVASPPVSPIRDMIPRILSGDITSNWTPLVTALARADALAPTDRSLLYASIACHQISFANIHSAGRFLAGTRSQDRHDLTGAVAKAAQAWIALMLNPAAIPEAATTEDPHPWNDLLTVHILGRTDPDTALQHGIALWRSQAYATSAWKAAQIIAIAQAAIRLRDTAQLTALSRRLDDIHAPVEAALVRAHATPQRHAMETSRIAKARHLALLPTTTMRLGALRAEALWRGHDRDAANAQLADLIAMGSSSGIYLPIYEMLERVPDWTRTLSRRADPTAPWIPNEAEPHPDRTPIPPLPRPLTPAEITVLTSLAWGRTTSEVGKRLGVSPNTVRAHVRSCYKKLAVHSKSEAIAAAHRRGLIGGDLP